MVVKVRSCINKIIGVSVCLLLSFSIYKKYYSTNNANHSIVVQTDSLLADATAADLTSFIQTYTQPHNHSSFSESIFSHFPCINSFQVEQNASGFSACTVESSQPLLLINNIWALTDGGRIACVQAFSSGATNSLHNVIMPRCVVTDAFKECVKKIPAYVFNHYQLIWLNDQEALLYDKQQPHFAIRFNMHSIPQEQIMQQCTAIKADLEMRGVFSSSSLSSKKKSQDWIADIRFKNQIIVSWNVGGTTYG